MSARIQSSFPAFELTIIVALLLIGWAAVKLYEIGPEVDESHQALRLLRDDYYLLSSAIQTNLNELDDALTNFLQGKDGPEVTRFQRQSKELSQWLGDRKQQWSEPPGPGTKPAAPSTNELFQAQQELSMMLGRVESTYTNYLKAATYLMANAGRPMIAERYSLRQQAAQRAKQHLMNIARKAQIRGEAMDLALAGSQNQFGGIAKRIRDLRLGLLMALVILSFLLMLGLYRRNVARTRTIIQEHHRQHLKQQATLDKLTHFGQLAQELAHEIKQPLTAMNARAYTLQKTLSSGTDAYKDAAVIRTEIKRLDRIVKDFLQLARPAEPQLAPVEARQALEEVRDLMSAHLDQDSIKFEFECDEDLEFLADMQQLKQVLINLVKNAAESLDHGGTVSLRGKKEARHFRGENMDVAVIEVEDTGPGIPPEIQAKIFEPFFSTKGDGTGLGLAIASRIIDKHGGNLEFDTELGKGTIFRIVLPSCRKEQTA
jgi:signal transduction histidine kinase